MDKEEIRRHIERYEKLDSDASTFKSNWQEIAEYMIPERANITTVNTPGQKNTSKIYDTTAIDALELWASGINGLMTNEALEWFNLEMEEAGLNSNMEVLEWLEDCVNRMHSAIRASNFQMEIYELYLDAGSVGTSSLYIREGKKTDLAFQARHVDEIRIVEDSEGFVDTLYRGFELTARQAEQEFTKKKLTPEILKSLEKGHGDDKDKKFKILHCIYPRTDDQRKKSPDGNFAKEPLSMPYASLYISYDEIEIIDEGGFEEFPYAVPRTKKMTGEVYGRSPAWNALPDIKMVNAMAKTYLRRIQKETDPPLQVPDEGYSLPIKIGPGGINFYSDPGGGRTSKIESILTGGQFQIADVELEKRRTSIRTKFFYDLWILPDQPNMTATEVLERIQQKLRIIGPFLGRFQTELLMPIVQRCFGILLRAGKFADPPEVLAQGGRIKVVFTSPISDAQQAYEAESLNKTLMMLTPVAQIKPEVLDNIDGDAVTRFYWKAMRAPQSLLFSEKDVEASRAERQKQMQEQQQAQELLAASQGMKNMKGTVLEDVAKQAIQGQVGTLPTETLQ